LGDVVLGFEVGDGFGAESVLQLDPAKAALHAVHGTVS
jgi:hypothetical protein